MYLIIQLYGKIWVMRNLQKSQEIIYYWPKLVSIFVVLGWQMVILTLTGSQMEQLGPTGLGLFNLIFSLVWTWKKSGCPHTCMFLLYWRSSYAYKQGFLVLAPFAHLAKDLFYSFDNKPSEAQNISEFFRRQP